MLRTQTNYCFWAYGPTEGVYMIERTLHLFVCSRIDASDEAHYGAGSWCNIGNKRLGNRVTAVLHTEAEILEVEASA